MGHLINTNCKEGQGSFSTDQLTQAFEHSRSRGIVEMLITHCVVCRVYNRHKTRNLYPIDGIKMN